jgi:hypothetical protein
MLPLAFQVRAKVQKTCSIENESINNMIDLPYDPGRKLKDIKQEYS